MKDYFVIPTNCPICNSLLVSSGEYLLCDNFDCPARIKGRILNWITELGLKEWGNELVQKLVDAKKVTTITDLYKLQVSDIANLDRLGEKTAKKCLDILWDNTEVSLEVFLGALSIPLIGQSTIKAIIKAGCDNIEKFGQLDANAFSQVAGVGPVKAQSLADGLKANQQIILDLLANGVKIKDITIGKLTGKSFAITGTLSIKRAELEKMIADNGGEVKNSVGKGLSYLIIADPQSTSSKAQAARKLGTVLIDEKQILDLIK
ncbi:MAG: helix-hairpin-helix domain-containing protein [Nitrosotalea sp.]